VPSCISKQQQGCVGARFCDLLGGRHLRKSCEHLADAKRKRVKREAAAEHHCALTELHAQRIGRIESEFSRALQAASSAHPPPLAADI
jgi:hypothetical protein